MSPSHQPPDEVSHAFARSGIVDAARAVAERRAQVDHRIELQPVGFRQIRLRFNIDTDAPQDKLDQLLQLTERYCVVYQTIAKGPPVDIKLSRV